MLNRLFEKYEGISVDSYGGLIVDYVKNNNIGSIIRGLRPTGDFEIEFQMASMNKQLFPEIETIFLMTEGQNYFISSSLVEEIHLHGGDIISFVPGSILEELNKK